MNGPVFEHAGTNEGFAAAELDPESGTATWPDGAGLAPDTLYERVKVCVDPPPSVVWDPGSMCSGVAAATSAS